ncbi:hypothetical protein TRFO_21116 [Tritrichomonas foetus]|uniref:Protein kinase domain-containing protein n=1 Tax=Tritrichomonas foetus TaxID=1144522 RepID=A0A1J4KFP4_9EUKA|nr:hypothetical protein TRFO_21116 [Tritrichomonas foetus]|eukprot:OHT09834.1 hypothetical protein TRFO_21116 [Tritrichomonas foetus]
MENSDFISSSLDDYVTETTAIEGTCIRTGFVKATQQKVALKSVQNDNFEILEAEAHQYAGLSHLALHSLATLYIPENKQESIMITPFMDNLSLDKFISKKDDETNQNKLNVIMKLLQICGICSAMEYLERNGITHRDLNPSNVLIDKDFRPHVKGYGIQKKFTPEEMLENEKIQIPYFAPEIIKGEEYTIKSDVYSFGLIINQMFTNEIPFSKCSTRKEIIRKISQHEKPELSSEIPRFLKELVMKCISDEPSSRITFKKLLKKLRSKFDCISGDTSVISTYLAQIRASIECPITFFRPPHIIVQEPSALINMEPNQTPILFDNLEKELQKAQGRPIHLIMVFGFYQSGKSTLLRTLTGNGAFYSGDNSKSTTMGILIDGPYSIDYLVERIHEESLRSICYDSNIKPDNDPAIFFLDSQGIGDEEFENYYRVVMERVHSIFCTVSDICINVTKMNEDKDNAQRILRTIRRSQMIGQNEDSNGRRENITKLLFLVRDAPESIQNQLSTGTRKAFQQAQKDFQPMYEKEHQVVSIDYYQDSISMFPLADLKTPRLYLFTIWNTLTEILFVLKSHKKHYLVDIRNKAQSLSTILFSGMYQLFSEAISTLEGFPSNLNHLSLAEKHIFYLGCFAQQYIKKNIEKCKEENRTSEEITNSILHILSIISTGVFPYVIGGDSISFGDYTQYSYELMNDMNAFINCNEPNWKSAAAEYKKSKWNYVKVALKGRVMGEIFSIPVLFASIPYVIPLGIVVVQGTVAVSIIKEVINSNNIKAILNNSMPQIIPFLWEKNIVKNQNLISINPKDINKCLKGVPSRYKLIIAIEQPECDLSAILQSFTGLEINFKDQSSVTAVIGPINANEMLNRTARCGQKLFSDIEGDVKILYLKGYTLQMMNQILEHQNHANRIFTATRLNKQLQVYPTRDLNFYVLTLVPELPLVTIYKKSIEGYLSEFESQFTEPVGVVKDIHHLPIIGQGFDFTGCGPRTNASIRYALHTIFRRKKMINETE